MYVKPHKQLRDLYVPENYHGTAFDGQEEKDRDPMPEEQPEQAPQKPEQEAAKAIPVQAKGMLPSLFSGFNGLRSDDLLLLSLILLLLRSEGEDGTHAAGEILPFLALLLFMG